MLFDALCIVSRQGARNNVADMIIIKTNGSCTSPPPTDIYISTHITTNTINSYLIILFIKNKNEYNMPDAYYVSILI